MPCPFAVQCRMLVSVASANPSAKGYQMARQKKSGGGCGCLISAVAVLLLLGAGWYFVVREDRSLDDPETVQGIKDLGRWFTSDGKPSVDRENLEAKILRRVNGHRKENGRNPLLHDERLSAIALAHSRAMAWHGYYPEDHINLLGENPTERARRAGYECVKPTTIGIAENAFLGYLYSSYTTDLIGLKVSEWRSYNWMTEDELADQVVDAWIASPGHNRNLMDARYTLSGLGVAFGTIDGIEHRVVVTHKFC